MAAATRLRTASHRRCAARTLASTRSPTATGLSATSHLRTVEARSAPVAVSGCRPDLGRQRQRYVLRRQRLRDLGSPAGSGAAVRLWIASNEVSIACPNSGTSPTWTQRNSGCAPHVARRRATPGGRRCPGSSRGSRDCTAGSRRRTGSWERRRRFREQQRRARSGSLGAHHAELLHRREEVDNPKSRPLARARSGG
jgi:hypothetical protein